MIKVNTFQTEPDAQYVLVDALGAGECFGANINGDYFPEASLRIFQAGEAGKQRDFQHHEAARCTPDKPRGFPDLP